ncbi:MAG TPA: hypothetical protein VNO14_04200 [Blastocatellia bacterium]|nr:hypothetical protein [Blastocatellia bacterium]
MMLARIYRHRAPSALNRYCWLEAIDIARLRRSVDDAGSNLWKSRAFGAR